MPHDDPVLRALCRDLTPWEQVAVIAGRQGRTIRIDQLRACGLSVDAVRAARRRHHLHRLTRGVFAVGVRSLEPLGRRWAAHLAVGADSAITGAAGAAMLGMGTQGARIEVASPTRRRDRTGARVRVREDMRPSWVRRDLGLPVLKTRYLFLDLADGLAPAALAVALNDALALRVVRLPELGRVIDRCAGHPGVIALEEAVQAAADDPGAGRTHGEFERLVLGLLRELPGLPAYVRNAPVELAGGRRAVADILLVGLGIIIELDSRRWHEQRRAMDSDRRRDQQAAAVGLLSFRITWRHATREWDAVSADLLAAIEVRVRERNRR